MGSTVVLGVDGGEFMPDSVDDGRRLLSEILTIGVIRLFVHAVGWPRFFSPDEVFWAIAQLAPVARELAYPSSAGERR